MEIHENSTCNVAVNVASQVNLVNFLPKTDALTLSGPHSHRSLLRHKVLQVCPGYEGARTGMISNFPFPG